MSPNKGDMQLYLVGENECLMETDFYCLRHKSMYLLHHIPYQNKATWRGQEDFKISKAGGNLEHIKKRSKILCWQYIQFRFLLFVSRKHNRF